MNDVAGALEAGRLRGLTEPWLEAEAARVRNMRGFIVYVVRRSDVSAARQSG